MIVERAMNDQFLSNTYLVRDGRGGPAFFVDAGGPVAPLIEKAMRLEVASTHVLLTHHHYDHVSELGLLCKRFPSIKVLVHPVELQALEASGALADADGTDIATIDAGELLRLGALEVRPLHTPGHTAGMLSFLVSDSGRRTAPLSRAPGPGGFMGGEAVVFTGDTLFKGSVGGVRAPGHTTYTDLKDSIMGTLMELPGETTIYPGHTDATTVGEEWERNPFIRVWRGLDAEGAQRCSVLGESATLVLLADDYDGGKKAWVRWPDGKDDIVPGSRVET